ncbi:AbrB/MazE/SpoVT family DNA-binding domain-containing protein, partial [Virgibacillus sp. 19R1-5]
MTATATVSKWGNSLGVRIPKDMADSANINQGTEMTIT